MLSAHQEWAPQWPWVHDALLRFAPNEALSWVDDQANPPCAHSVSYVELVQMVDRVSCVVGSVLHAEEAAQA